MAYATWIVRDTDTGRIYQVTTEDRNKEECHKYLNAAGLSTHEINYELLSERYPSSVEELFKEP